WMESLHICRTSLLESQKKTAKHLNQLIRLNPTAKALRLALQMAQIELAVAIAAENPFLIAKATKKILQIEKQRQQLDRLQKSLIALGNFELSRGAAQALLKLRKQN